MHDDTTGCVSDEISLREVVSDARGVIHVAMRETDVVDGDDLSRRSSDVETDVEFRRGDDRFLARKGKSEEFDVIDSFFN